MFVSPQLVLTLHEVEILMNADNVCLSQLVPVDVEVGLHNNYISAASVIDDLCGWNIPLEIHHFLLMRNNFVARALFHIHGRFLRQTTLIYSRRCTTMSKTVSHVISTAG